MPSSTARFDARVQYSTGQTEPFASGTFVTDVLSKPASSKRSRPADLWANGTNRDVIHRRYSTDPIRYQHFNYGKDDWIIGDIAARVIDTTLQSTSSSFDCTFLHNRVRNKIRGDAVNLGTALAEYKQTASMFETWAKRAVTLSKALVKRDPRFLLPRKQWSPSKAAANAWLEYTYGLKPLVSDIDGAMKALAERSSSRPIYISGKCSFRTGKTLNRTASPPNYLYYSGSKIQVDELVETDYVCSYRAKLSSSYLASTLAGHGVLNIPALAYELTPYSFVLDWFLNVGDVLSSLDNLVMFDELLVRHSATQVVTGTFTATGRSISGGCTAIYKIRSRKAPFPISLIVTPEYKPSVSLNHIASGMALLRQARR